MGPSRLAAYLCFCLPLAALSASAAGDPWTLVSPPPPRLSALDRVGDTLFAVTSRGLFTLNPAAMTWSFRPGGFSPAPDLPGDASGFPPRIRGEMFPGLIADTTFTVLSDSNLFRYEYNGMNWIPWKLANPGLGSLKEIFLHQGALLVSGAKGIARSEDKGKTWMKPAMPSGIPTFTSFCERGDTLYAGVSISIPAPLGGLFRSLDDGTTWTPLEIPADSQPRVKLPASRKGPLVMVMTDSLYVSTNGGSTWRERGPAFMRGSGPENWVKFDGRTLLVHRGDSFSISLDAGASWTKRILVRDSLKSTYVGPDRMAITDSALWLTSDYGALFVSRDQGLTWKRAENLPVRPALVRAEGKTLMVLPITGTQPDPNWSPDEGATWKGALAKRDIIDLIRQGGEMWAGSGDRYGQGDGVFLSQDSGFTWTREGLDGLEVRDLELNGRGPGLLAATGKGVFARDPTAGKDWHQILPQVTDAQSISGEGDMLAAVADTGGNHKVWYFSADGGKSAVLQPILSSAPPVVFGNRFLAVDSARLSLIEVKAGKIEATRKALIPETGFPAPLWDDRSLFYTSLLTGNPYFLLGTTEGLYQSADSGWTWQPSPSPLGKQNIDYLVRMGDRIAVVNQGGAWMTDDGGRSWAKTDSLPVNDWDRRLAVKSSEAMAVLGVQFGGLRILSRDGKWSKISMPKEAVVRSASSFAVIGANVLLGDTSLYRSHDMGSTWTATKQTGCIGSDWGVVGTVLMARGFPLPCPDTVPSMASNPLILSQDTGRTWMSVDPGLFKPPLPAKIAPFLKVDGIGLIASDSILYASWDGADWISLRASLGEGVLAPAATRLYRAGSDGLYVLPLVGGPISIADRPALPPRPPVRPRFAGSRSEVLTSAVYFPAKGRFDLSAVDVRGRSYRVRTGIGADGPGLQSISWRAPAPGIYMLRLTP
jgi:photosystem II stability/assembly factor-like uncharacterized protein